jgi:hypothetical protein
MLMHFYETAVVESTGFRASILNLSGFPDSAHGSNSRFFLRDAGFELEPVRSPSDAFAALERLATSSFERDDIPISPEPPDVRGVIEEVWTSPLVIVEASPALGRTLSSILSQGGAAWLAAKTGSAGLVVAYETGLIVVWFVAGPVIGAREGLRQAAEDATRQTGYVVFRDWLNKRFGK